jgi:hypothetical protein
VTFYTEPTGYTKTVLSDLQGAWQNLRDTVVEAYPFPESGRLLLYIDEGMSWENVRNLDNMRKALLLTRNIAVQSKVPDEVFEWIETVRANVDEVFAAIAEGKVLWRSERFYREGGCPTSQSRRTGQTASLAQEHLLLFFA